jgi:hypothetical protein
MVSSLRHVVGHLDKELWDITSRWCGRLGVLVDWQRDWIKIVCSVEYFQPCRWTLGDLSW